MTSVSVDAAGDRVRALVKRRDIAGLGHALFGLKAVPKYEGPGSWTPTQREIAGLFAFLDHKRAAITIHTRFGKTFSAGTGLAAMTIIDPRALKVAVATPRATQTNLLRSEFIAALTRNPAGRRLLGIGNRKLDDRMRRELSRQRLDLRDGKRFRFMSTGPDGEAQMGEGADVLIVDEADLIPEDAWPKLLRMLGDNPDHGVLVLIGNPWHRGGRFDRALNNPAYKVIRADWRRGVAEGRTTEAFVAEQRAELPPALFQVFWDSTFPDAAEGQLIAWPWIEACTVRRDAAGKLPPFGDPEAPAPQVRYGLDVAEGGTDFSVLSRALWQGAKRRLERQWDWHFADTMATAAHAASLMEPGAEVWVDANGVGKGVADRLRQLGFIVREWKASEAASDSARYQNRKAESWWKLREAIERGDVELAEIQRVRNDLPRMTWRLQQGRILVEELDGKSPDWGDSAHLSLIEDATATPKIIQRGYRPQKARI